MVPCMWRGYAMQHVAGTGVYDPGDLLVGLFSDPQTWIATLRISVSSRLVATLTYKRMSRICLVSSVSSGYRGYAWYPRDPHLKLKVKDIDVCLLLATLFGSPMHANPWFIG